METKDIIENLIEKGNLTDFQTAFGTVLGERIAAAKEVLKESIARDFDYVTEEDGVTVDEAAGVIGKGTDSTSGEKPEADDDSDEPDDEKDADDPDEKDEKDLEEAIKGMEGPFNSPKGITYYYDQKEGLYYDAGSDIYVTAKTLGIQ